MIDDRKPIWDLHIFIVLEFWIVVTINFAILLQSFIIWWHGDAVVRIWISATDTVIFITTYLKNMILYCIAVVGKLTTFETINCEGKTIKEKQRKLYTHHCFNIVLSTFELRNLLKVIPILISLSHSFLYRAFYSADGSGLASPGWFNYSQNKTLLFCYD